MKKLGPVTYSVDIGEGRTVKRHKDQLRQKVHRSPKSTSNMINDYYYYEPVTLVEDVNPVLQTPPQRTLEEEERYTQRQYRLPERLIHENY